MKKILAAALILGLLSASLAFAGGGSEKSGGADKEVTYKLAHSYQPAHAFSKGVKKLIEVVKEKSAGKFVINEFPAAQLGSEKDITDGAVNGVIDIVIIGPGEIGKRYKPVLIFEGPFLFSGYDHAQKVLKGDIGKELWDGCLKATGLRQLATLYYGTRYVTSKKPIRTPDDMKGMKLRAPDMPMSVANARAMGANPTPMALSEVYLALQQNVVDGQENPIPTIFTQKFFEVQSHINMTGHVFQVTPLFIGEKKFQALSPAFQKILVDAVAVVAPTIDQEIMSDEKKMLEEMKAKGMQVVQPDVASFVKATASVYKDFESNWGPELYNKIQALR